MALILRKAPDVPPPTDGDPGSTPEFHALTSVWNQQLPDNAPLATDPVQASMATRVTTQARASKTGTALRSYYDGKYRTAFNQLQYSYPIYRMPLDTPRVEVQVLRWWDKTDVPDSYQSGLPLEFKSVPLPDKALCKGGKIEADGNDEHAVLICGDELWEFWKLHYDSTRGHHVMGNGAYIQNYHLWDGKLPSTRGARACSMSAVGGVVSIKDWLAGVITHALALAAPLTGPSYTSFVPPASRTDALMLMPSGQGQIVEDNRVKQGTHLRLPATFDVEAYCATKFTAGSNERRMLRMLCYAARDYGIYITDSSGVVSFYAEDERTAGTPYSQYATAQIGGTDCEHEFPYESLVTLEPHAT